MRVLLLIVLLPFLIAQAYGSVYITDVRIIPEEIKVNDTLIVEANIFNNSDEIIEYRSLCDSPLDVKFDNNIVVEYGVGCLGFTTERLEPFESVTVRGPASGLFYRVVDEGLTRANITFTYQTDGEYSIHKEIIFMIGEKSVGNTIGINQTIILDGLEITLLDIEDFRCPVEVRCVWAGDATFSLAIKRDGYIENRSINLYRSLLIDNLIGNKAIKVVSLEPANSIYGIDKSEYKARFELVEVEDSIRFKAYNDKYGIIGVVARDQGTIILFKDGKREVLRVSNYDECNRLGSMICFNVDNMHIEVSKDFILIDKVYIPTINIRLI